MINTLQHANFPLFTYLNYLFIIVGFYEWNKKSMYTKENALKECLVLRELFWYLSDCLCNVLWRIRNYVLQAISVYRKNVMLVTSPTNSTLNWHVYNESILSEILNRTRKITDDSNDSTLIGDEFPVLFKNICATFSRLFLLHVYKQLNKK